MEFRKMVFIYFKFGCQLKSPALSLGFRLAQIPSLRSCGSSGAFPKMCRHFLRGFIVCSLKFQLLLNSLSQTFLTHPVTHLLLYFLSSLTESDQKHSLILDFYSLKYLHKIFVHVTNYLRF